MFKFLYCREVIIGAIVILTFVGLILFSPAARGHQAPSGWEYDHDCCHNKDCAPITNVEQSGSGLNITTTITNSLNLKGVITPNTSYRKSQDKLDHACIINGNVRCYYGGEKF